MSRLVERLHLIRALSWIPLTGGVFLLGWENVVAVTLLYSAYANVESGLATWQGRRAERHAQDS